MSPTPGIGCIKLLEFDTQNRALNAVHSCIPANARMKVFAGLAVIAHDFYFSLKLRIIGDNGAGCPKGAEILAGIKTKAPRRAHRACFSPFVDSAVRLAGIL